MKAFKTVIVSNVFYGCETWYHSLRKENKVPVLEN
jgi:hypothetical protein